MAEGLVFLGAFDGSGAFRPDPEHAARMVRARRKLAGKRAEVVFRRPRSKRSIEQNAYAHKWPFRLIAEAMGESVEAAKLCILGEKFGWHEVRGHLLPMKPSTAALTVAEFSELIEWMPVFAAEMFPGLVIPLPSEVDA